MIFYSGIINRMGSVRIFLHVFLIFSLLCLPLFLFIPQANSDEYDKITEEINDLTHALEQSIAATTPLESQVKNMQQQIASLKQRIAILEIDLQTKKKDIEISYENLEQKQKLLSQIIRAYYVKSYSRSPLLLLLSNRSSDITRQLAYEQTRANQDKAFIANMTLSITTLETRREELAVEQKKLVAAKANLDEQSEKLNGIIVGAKAYQQDVSSKIAALSARQQEILAARSGSFIFSMGDSELADDYNASIKGFRESAPSGSFAVFSFGAYTHRKGLSQYGARGRAQNGQNYKEILSKYYGKEPVNKDTGGDINVDGFGAMNFEDRYLMGIAEMPSSWNMEALKAQAVAARSFAYRYKTQGSSICTTEACQVYSDSKAASPPDAWRSAVQSTKGEVVEDVVTYYSSTTGGYITTSGWDTTDGSGGSNFIDKAYEKIGGSPWVYKAWYRRGYANTGDSCGRSNPWLTSEEIADIINAALYRDDRVTPITTSCWGGNPYSYEELRDKANGPANVSSVTVTQGDGSTNEVIFQTDKGELRLSGSDFKTAFNLRAPGYMSIPQSGFSFFNIEKK